MTQFIVILAVGPNEEAALARHDRCARYASTQNLRVRRRLVLTNGDELHEQLRAVAQEMIADTILVESLAELGPDAVENLALLDFLRKKSMRILSLKEGCTANEAQLHMLQLFSAVFTELEPLPTVFIGERHHSEAARHLVDRLGWDLLIPRSKTNLGRLRTAQGKLAIIPALDSLGGDSSFERLLKFIDLKDAGQAFFIMEAGLDSRSPGFVQCLKAQLGLKSQLDEMRPQEKERPGPSEILSTWVALKTRRKSGTIGDYTKTLGFSASYFFKYINQEIQRIKRSFDRTKSLDATAKEFNLASHEVDYILNWLSRSESRSHSSSS